MRQKKESGESDKAASNRVVTEVNLLSADVTAMVKAAGGGGAEGVTLKGDQAGRIDHALSQLAALSRAIADFDQVKKGASPHTRSSYQPTRFLTDTPPSLPL